MTQAASGSFEQNMGAQDNMRGFCKKARSRWSVYEIGAMVLGFVVFWPLGLLALFAKLKNGEMWTGAGSGEAPWASWKKPSMGGWQSRAYGYASTGNAAFDEYKRAQLAKLEEQRRKLDEEQKAFRDHLWRLRKAKDQEEFDRFMAERTAPPPSETPST